jgi:predicted Zn-dependent protease
MADPDYAADIRAALASGAYAQALDAAQVAVAEHPNDAFAHRLLGATQSAAGQNVDALASLDRAVALAPDDADAHFERAGVLLGERKLDDAQQALARSIGLDPNLFGAYVLQAQLALGRGDLEEVARLHRFAARIAADDPGLVAIEGMLALRQGDAARAQVVLANALQKTPGHTQLSYALGFVYMEQGHFAFAEQMFRNVLAQNPDARNLHAMIADMLRQQGRPGEAVQEIAPLLADPQHATPGLRRIAGELELAADQPERALPWLRDSLGAQPDDRRTLLALMEAWRRLGTADDARTTLDAALATSPNVTDLWHARLAFEPVGGDSARAVVSRWLTATPESIAALEAQMALQDMGGDAEGAMETAQRIVTLEPGRSSGEIRLLEGMLDSDPSAAVARVNDLMSRAPSPDSLPLLRGWLGIAQDRAGQSMAAVATWSQLHGESVTKHLPLWQPSTSRVDWPALGVATVDSSVVGLLWGAPGSAVERVAVVLANGLPAFRADRFSPTPPQDALQQFRAIADLGSGALTSDLMIAQWRSGLSARGVDDGQIVDWLPYWDNALLMALRPQLPDALLLVALRDPRDMLLDWLAFGSTLPPLAMVSPMIAARWLAQVLEQVATLHEQDLFPHQLLRLDAILDQPQALADAVSAAIQTPLPAPDANRLGPPHFPAGHWRDYAQALAEPFALLTPVAQRLGYE